MSSLVLKGPLTAALIAGTALAAADKFSEVKEIFLDREHHPTAIGMRYDIELERPDGSRMEVPVTYDFHSGDRIRLRVDVRSPAYVYVLNRTLNGPDRGISLVRDEDAQKPPAMSETPRLVFGPERLIPGATRIAPKSAAMRFDENTGIEKLYVVVSAKPLPLENMFDREGHLLFDRARRDSIGNLNRDLAAWSGNAKSAVPDKDGAKGLSQDNNGYCVERRPNEPLMQEISLRHSR